MKLASIFQIQTVAPFHTLETDPSGFTVYQLRVRHRFLGEGTVWGVGRATAVNPTMQRFETRQVYTFL